MPREHLEEEIVFEDLRGNAEDAQTVVEVDLDADGDPAITRRPARIDSGGDDDNDDMWGDDDESRRRAPKSDDSRDDDPDDDADGRDREDDFHAKFDKRLKRERRAKEAERTRADEAEKRAVKAERDLKKARLADSGTNFDKQISDLEGELEQAIEDGDTKKHVRLTSQLQSLNAEKVAAKYVVDDDDDDPADRTPTPPRADPERVAMANDWKSENRSWYQRRGFERATRIANELDDDVHAEGFDARDEDYYEELDKRVRERLPELFDKSGDLKTPGRRGRNQKRKDRGRTPVADTGDGADRGRRRRSASSSRVELDSDDFANMERFGLNSRDPEVLKEYALNKRQRMQEEADA